LEFIGGVAPMDDHSTDGVTHEIEEGQIQLLFTSTSGVKDY
jgi:hypothetical protein